MNPQERKAIENHVLKAAVEVVRKGEGALFVVGDKVPYQRLLKQQLVPFNVHEEGTRKILVSLATIDGAVIIDSQGYVQDYAALVKSSKAFRGFGTRHAAGISASKNGNTSILCSEEQQHIKVFKDGKCVKTINPFAHKSMGNESQLTTALESVGAGFLGSLGVSLLVPAFGVALLPGTAVIGGGYYAAKALKRSSKKASKLTVNNPSVA